MKAVCMFIHGRPSGSNGTTDIYNQTTCKRMLHKIVSLLENSQHSQHSRPWRFVDQCLPASQITCRLGVPSAPVSGQHEQAYSRTYRRTQNERHSSVQIKRWIDQTRWLGRSSRLGQDVGRRIPHINTDARTVRRVTHQHWRTHSRRQYRRHTVPSRGYVPSV